MTGDSETMGSTTGRPDDGTNGPAAGDTADDATPHQLDAIGRELLALRAMATAVVAMVDATLTNFHAVQLGARPVVTLARDPQLAATIVDTIRRQSGLSGDGVPRTFGDGKGTRRDAPAAGDTGTTEGVTTS